MLLVKATCCLSIERLSLLQCSTTEFDETGSMFFLYYSKQHIVNSPLRLPDAEERPQGALPLERGHFHLRVAFYRMKIGLFLAEIWPKMSRNPIALGPKRGGGALIGSGALNGEFTVLLIIIIKISMYINNFWLIVRADF